MLFMLSFISPFISAQGEVIDGNFAQRQSLTPGPLQNRERETKPHPQPLSEERGEWLLFEMEGVVWGVKVCGDVVDNKG